MLTIAGIAACSACTDNQKVDSNSLSHGAQEWPIVQRLGRGELKITTRSGQSVTIWSGEKLAGVDVNLTVAEDPSTKEDDIFLKFSRNRLENTTALIADSMGVQELLILSSKEINKVKYIDSSTFRR